MQINIQKKHLLVLIAVLSVITVALVYAYSTPIPDPGHGGDTILVTAGGSEKTLQAAITDGSIGGGGGTTLNCVTNSSRNIAGSAIALCPAGYIVTGGGGKCDTTTNTNAGRRYLNMSIPSYTNGWKAECEIYGASYPQNSEAYVVCCRIV